MEVIIAGFKHTGISEPNICPHCHVTNYPKIRFQQQTRDTDNSQCNYQVWECSNMDCRKLFGVLYKRIDGDVKITSVFNGLPKGPIWPKPIIDLIDGNTIETNQELKSKFIKTYLQSLEAESHGLDEIAGMGYRKAIEYLVKDWAIQNNKDKKEEILKKWLKSTISDFYDGDLKEILLRATWLGNDQTHYNKLFQEYNIENLKDLIDLIMVELDRDFKKKHYIENIEKRN